MCGYTTRRAVTIYPVNVRSEIGDYGSAEYFYLRSAGFLDPVTRNAMSIMAMAIMDIVESLQTNSTPWNSLQMLTSQIKAYPLIPPMSNMASVHIGHRGNEKREVFSNHDKK